MKNFVCCILFVCSTLVLQAQIAAKLSSAMRELNNDSQLKFATVGLYVVDAATGKVVFDQNGNVGMATASTLKVITAATALSVLGKDYTYETKVGIVATPKGKSLYIQASGDPTLGSWRWEQTKDSQILQQVRNAVKQSGEKQFESVIISTKAWMKDDGVPGKWIWEDLGQYYGAGAQGLNWHENQFDLILKSGAKIGDPVSIVDTKPYLYDYKIASQATAAGNESGDQSSLYFPSKGDGFGVLRGTIPAGKSSFVVSGAIYDPTRQFAKTIINTIENVATVKSSTIEILDQSFDNPVWIYTHTSPELSKIVYWFLQKSINLYGEALLKTVALKLTGEASTDKGIEAVQKFWADKNVDREALHLSDGSGLSPQNRVTPQAEVAVLQYAKKQSWFAQFYDGLPVYNTMKMKSGTINRVKGFTGYQKSKEGTEYIFSILINNYNGSQYPLIRKMYKVLDNLK